MASPAMSVSEVHCAGAMNFDKNHGMLYYWDYDKARLPKNVKVGVAINNIIKSLKAYDPLKFIHRLVVYGDLSGYIGGPSAFDVEVNVVCNANNVECVFRHFPERFPYCSDECKAKDGARYPQKTDGEKTGLSLDRLKHDLTRVTYANSPPYHVAVVSSDAQWVKKIDGLVESGIIVHVACKNDAHSSLMEVGYLLWDWDMMIKGYNHAFKILR